MATFLHTMVRVTDPPRSRAFYEALGFTFNREMDIVRNGEKEATNYFYSLPNADNVLELTYNHDGRGYEMGTAYANEVRGRTFPAPEHAFPIAPEELSAFTTAVEAGSADDNILADW